eukprot:9479182-Pyramimonas_sp.AAC.1
MHSTYVYIGVRLYGCVHAYANGQWNYACAHARAHQAAAASPVAHIIAPVEGARVSGKRGQTSIGQCVAE